MSRLMGCIAAMVVLTCAGVGFAQNGGGGGGRGGPGGPGGGGRFGGAMNNPYRQLIDNIAEANLAPGFDLTADQKTKLAEIREGVRKDQEKWRTEHADDFRKLREEAANAAQGADRQAMRDLMQKRQDLMATAPKTDDAIKAIKALLTEEQQKKLTEVTAQRQAEQDALRQEMGGGFGRGPAGGGGAGGGGGRGGRGGRGGGAGGGGGNIQ